MFDMGQKSTFLSPEMKSYVDVKAFLGGMSSHFCYVSLNCKSAPASHWL